MSNSPDMTSCDGTTLVTREGMIFQAFGYIHPPERTIAYLKYVPLQLRGLFPARFLETRWVYKGYELLRLKEFYSPQEMVALREAFRKHFPEYLFHDLFLGLELTAIPRERIAEAYCPQETLRRLVQKGKPDDLEGTAIFLVEALTSAAGVGVEDFGIHGSLALGMHQYFSDIDLTVHGGANYRRVLLGVHELALEGFLTLQAPNEASNIRGNKGVFKGRRFVVNAVRRLNELKERYGQYRYFPLDHVVFMATVRDDEESDFKPSIYGIGDYKNLAGAESDPKPSSVVSMISSYRGLVRRGQSMKGEGMLERVVPTDGSPVSYRVVIGSGDVQNKEYVWPASL